MTCARYWDRAALVCFWLAAAAAFGLARWSLKAGTYRVAVDGVDVIGLQGLWTPAFASGGTLIFLAVTVGAIAISTVSWVAGRKDRDAVDLAARSGHRPLLK